MRVLFVTPEATPLFKIGGLGDVSGSLPLALAEKGVDIRMLMPYVDTIRLSEPEKRLADLSVIFDGRKERIRMYSSFLPGKSVPVYLPAHRRFSGKNLFDPERFALLAAIAIALSRGRWKPNLIHGNDWFAGEAIAAAAKNNIPTLLTIHNLSYNQDELKIGITHATKINTVSRQYAKEILTKAFGSTLVPILRARKKDLSGILNGIDVRVWNPATDRAIPHQYTRSSVRAQKKMNKTALLQTMKLPETEDFVLGFIGRLDAHQKGIDKILSIIPALVRHDYRIIILGTGNPEVEKALRSIAKKYPDHVAATLRFDEPRAHIIYAGADAMLLPSTFEPSGLVQMISMRYGTVPIAHAVGGLKDTIIDRKTGFLYTTNSAAMLKKTILRAQKVFQDHLHWQKIVASAMKQNFSWASSANEYKKLYTLLCSLSQHHDTRTRTAKL